LALGRMFVGRLPSPRCTRSDFFFGGGEVARGDSAEVLRVLIVIFRWNFDRRYAHMVRKLRTYLRSFYREGLKHKRSNYNPKNAALFEQIHL